MLKMAIPPARRSLPPGRSQGRTLPLFPRSGFRTPRSSIRFGNATTSGPLTPPPPPFTPPAQPTSGTPPAPIVPVAKGWKFTASLVNRIKSHAAYELADGQDLDIEGAEEAGADSATTKPVSKAVRGSGGHVEVQWPKRGFTALKLEVDRGTGTFVYLATATEPHYVDTVTLAPGATALWKYRAIYRDGDQGFGQWSDVGSIAVVG